MKTNDSLKIHLLSFVNLNDTLIFNLHQIYKKSIVTNDMVVSNKTKHIETADPSHIFIGTTTRIKTS